MFLSEVCVIDTLHQAVNVMLRHCEWTLGCQKCPCVCVCVCVCVWHDMPDECLPLGPELSRGGPCGGSTVTLAYPAPEFN